jgi:uncharacterized protein YutD
MSDVLEGINQYIVGYKQPRKNDFLNQSEKMMEMAEKMHRFLDNIDDDRKRETMKRNISVMQQMIVDNLEMYNEWLNQKAREQE